MDPLHFCIATIPVAAYLLLIGWVNLSRRPLITTGVRDLAALALAVTGFIVVGPMELFLPETVASLVGGWVWVPMILLYALITTLVLLLMKPKLIVYNTSAEQLRPIVKEVMLQLDPEARWAGDCVVAPKLGVQMAIESYSGVRNVTLVSVGPDQNLDGWDKINHKLQTALANEKQVLNSQGLGYLFLSAALVAAIVYSLLSGRQEIAQAFHEMLRL